jgi:hypothetical protein
MYTCEICEYNTNERTAIYHHNKTKKHLLNKNEYEKNIKEENENELLKSKQKKIEELEKKLSEIEKEKEKELLMKDREIEKLEVKAQVYKELAEKSKNVNNGIIINNNMSYVNKHFKNAPPLKKISNYKINGINLEDDNQIYQLTEKIIYSVNNKCLHKLIGDHIVENYKKDDLQLQSFHATDVARRKYLVKLEDNMGFLYDESSDEIDNYDPDKEVESDSDEYDDLKKEYEKEQKSKVLVKKNKSKWTNDNEGVKLSYLLFEPLIRKIIRQLKKKCRDHNNEVKKNKKKILSKDEAERFETLSNLLKEIDKDKLKKSINNYIAPHFGLVKE